MIIFVGGSISIRSLTPEVQEHLSNIIKRGFPVVIGDAPGADSTVQRFFADHNYRSVTIYHVGNCRNNLGGWSQRKIVPKNGTPFFVCKDQAMAADADYGFMIWDGKSRGTRQNILELVKLNKRSIVFVEPTNETVQILP